MYNSNLENSEENLTDIKIWYLIKEIIETTP